MPERILLVDDDRSILTLVSDVMGDNGLDVTAASSAADCLDCLKKGSFDIIVLDVMMDGTDGFELCKQIREQVACPIIFLSARDSSADIVKGLSLGADDYLTKPFVIDELVARVNAHLRRQSRVKAPVSEAQSISLGDVTISLSDRSVYKAGQAVSLSTREFDLLAYLMKNSGKTVSREQLFHDVWNTDYGDIGTVAINIKNLRTKIDPQWAYIKTIWGSGYRFAAPNDMTGR